MSKIEELKDNIYDYFKENEDEFVTAIEALDSYCGYLGDDRVEYMDAINEFYSGTEPLEVLYRAFYGHDGDNWSTDEHGDIHYAEFNPNREYFYFNGYGNFVSTDYKDYSDHLDNYFIDKVIDEFHNIRADLPSDVVEWIEKIENLTVNGGDEDEQ